MARGRGGGFLKHTLCMAQNARIRPSAVAAVLVDAPPGGCQMSRGLTGSCIQPHGSYWKTLEQGRTGLWDLPELPHE